MKDRTNKEHPHNAIFTVQKTQVENNFCQIQTLMEKACIPVRCVDELTDEEPSPIRRATQ